MANPARTFGGFEHLSAQPFHWFFIRFRTYAIGILITVAAFVAASAVYVFFLAGKSDPISIPRIEMPPVMKQIDPTPPDNQRSTEGGAYVAWGSGEFVPANKFVEAEIVGIDGKTIGRVTNLIVDSKGQANTVVTKMGLEGLKRENIVVPFKAVEWQTGADALPVSGVIDDSADWETVDQVIDAPIPGAPQ